MSSEDRQESEDFNLEIDSAVESFFSRYEESPPKVDVSSDEPGSENISEEKNTSETDDSSLEPIFAMLSGAENAHEKGGSSDAPETGVVGGKEKVDPEKNKVGSADGKKKKFDPTDTHVFNSLTEAILTVDWEVTDANVNEAREILLEIQTNFPALKESMVQEVIDEMLAILDSMALSPQRVTTSAIAQLEKAIPILRGIASGAQVEDGYQELIEDALAGLKACRVKDEHVEDIKTESSDPMADGKIFFDAGDGVTSETEVPEPIAVPAEISRTLCRHYKVVEQLIPRAKRVSNLYSAAQGSEKIQAVLQKICGLLELQTRALADGFSLDCDMAIFPIGKIDNLSEFIDFQMKSMGACLRHARVTEKTFEKHPHRKKFRQSVYFLRIAMEKQMDELSTAARDDDTPA